jgi:hypothetical protein
MRREFARKFLVQLAVSRTIRAGDGLIPNEFLVNSVLAGNLGFQRRVRLIKFSHGICASPDTIFGSHRWRQVSEHDQQGASLL